MSLFLLLYLLLYGGMNVYIFFRLLPVLRRVGWWLPLALAALLVFMVAGPILARMLERTDMVRLAQVVGAITYTWMALALWFFFLGVLIDLWNASFAVAGWRWPTAAALRLPPSTAVPLIGGLVLLAGIWGAFEAHFIRLERVELTTPRLPAGAPPIRIAQISDLHLGLIERDGRLSQVLDLLEREKPDLILATGDLVDGSAHHMEHLTDMLAAHRPPLGKFAILGNHEWYVGMKNSIGFLEASGFTVLRGETLAVGPLLLAGVDDPAGLRRDPELVHVEHEALPAADVERPFTILLKHRPWVEESSQGRFDLQLSGHTHNGQIFPFNWIVRTQYRYLRGLYELNDGARLYVSRGTGTWGPRLRLGSPPELTIFTLTPE